MLFDVFVDVDMMVEDGPGANELQVVSDSREDVWLVALVYDCQNLVCRP